MQTRDTFVQAAHDVQGGMIIMLLNTNVLILKVFRIIIIMKIAQAEITQSHSV